MRVDFYQLGGAPVEAVLASLATRILADDGRLLIVADDEAFLARLDRLLWDQGAASFLPHAIAGGADDARQPILLATTPDTPNLARNFAIADGVWRGGTGLRPRFLSVRQRHARCRAAGVEAARRARRRRPPLLGAG